MPKGESQKAEYVIVQRKDKLGLEVEVQNLLDSGWNRVVLRNLEGRIHVHAGAYEDYKPTITHMKKKYCIMITKDGEDGRVTTTYEEIGDEELKRDVAIMLVEELLLELRKQQ